MRTTTRRLSIAAATLTTIAAVAGIAGQKRAVEPEELFVASDRCLSCHNGMTARNGEDASIGTRWRSTVMAHAAKDPYWQASVRREVDDHPVAAAAIEDKCATCHMPMARFADHLRGEGARVFSLDEEEIALASDGVSCAVCHQIDAADLGKEASFGGGFGVDTTRAPGSRAVFGPFAIADGTARIMSSATGFVPREADHIRKAELCASCHTLFTHALDKDGNEVGELAEQAPYLEWLHSDYAESQSCQDCHMRSLPGEAPISSVLGKPRGGLLEHVFRGGNFLLLRLLSANRSMLGVDAAPSELEAARNSSISNLVSAAAGLSVSDGGRVEDGRLVFGVTVENTAGHKLPSAYPSRRVWLRVVVSDANGSTIFESGALREDGAIEGNDNDEDPSRFEPHHLEIVEAGQVQIYESIMGTPAGEVTTGLLRAAQYLKDNRVTPFGFDKKTADDAVAVDERAMSDESFTEGRDETVFSVPVGAAEGPFAIEAELWYQPIGYRWAMNLDESKASEPRRFVSMYRALPGRDSAVRLAKAKGVVEPPPPIPETEAVQTH